MKRTLSLLLLAFVLVLAGCGDAAPTPTPIPTATPAATNTSSPTSTSAPTDTPLPTATSVPTDTLTSVPTNTVVVPTDTSQPTATSVPTGTATSVPTATSPRPATNTPLPPPTPTVAVAPATNAALSNAEQDYVNKLVATQDSYLKVIGTSNVGLEFLDGHRLIGDIWNDWLAADRDVISLNGEVIRGMSAPKRFSKIQAKFRAAEGHLTRVGHALAGAKITDSGFPAAVYTDLAAGKQALSDGMDLLAPYVQPTDTTPPISTPEPVAPAATSASDGSGLVFQGIGATNATRSFDLTGGSYKVAWSEHPINSDWPYDVWHFGVSIHGPSDTMDKYLLLFSMEDVPANGSHSGSVVVNNVQPGTYVVDVAASDSYAWTIALTPLIGLR